MYPFRAEPSCIGRYMEYTPKKLRYFRSNSLVYKDPSRDFVTFSSSQISGNITKHTETRIKQKMPKTIQLKGTYGGKGILSLIKMIILINIDG